jgi:hypothetical protein
MKTKQTTITKEWDWEKEASDMIIGMFLLRGYGIVSWDGGEKKTPEEKKVIALIKKVEAQTRATTLDECLEIIGEDERQREYITDLGIKDDFEGVRGLIRNKLRQDLRQAINSLKEV